MLVARRDPPFHAGRMPRPRIWAPIRHCAAHRLIRFMTVMQLLGSLVAIPVGLASAYSIYHANFSVEATCQSLRASIVAMLDKSVDATTRRMLVRRDVVTFEQNCGTVDPDATTAFKALLAAEKTAAVTPRRNADQRGRPGRSEGAKRRNAAEGAGSQSRAASAARRQAAGRGRPTEPVRRDAAASDAQWVDAVRQALVTHRAEPAQIDRPKAPAVPASTLAPCAARARRCQPVRAPLPWLHRLASRRHRRRRRCTSVAASHDAAPPAPVAGRRRSSGAASGYSGRRAAGECRCASRTSRVTRASADGSRKSRCWATSSKTDCSRRR